MKQDSFPITRRPGADRSAGDRRLRKQQRQQLQLRRRLRLAARIDRQPTASSRRQRRRRRSPSARASPKLGKNIVDSKGFTLYDFHKDKGTTSTCYGGCAQVWPPLTTEGEPKAGEGAMASKLGTTKRKDGTVQVTYAGHPLYTYTADTKPGDAKGNDFSSFGAEWYALQPERREAEG